jgi:hypothetical protein
MIPDLYHGHAHGHVWRGGNIGSNTVASICRVQPPVLPLQRENTFIVSGLDIPPEGFRVFLRRPDSYYYYKVKSPAIENAHNACEGI